MAHTDDLAPAVENGAAAVAWVEGGVGLHEADSARRQAPVEGADDSRGDCEGEAEGVSHRQDVFADFRLAGRAELEKARITSYNVCYTKLLRVLSHRNP